MYLRKGLKRPSLLRAGFFGVRFKTGAAQDRQDGVFVITGIGFGPFAQQKNAAFGALNDFDVPAGGAQPDARRDLHRRSLAWNLEQGQRYIDAPSVFQV